ncbi:hypothetical protein [Dactylosporangium sp. NPDC049140]|uniref:hypothetical protein n=1 Tax=Dactylosporangium sp. NPDC049140 TaxID=3155647 RepID=UPI0033D676BF
MQKIAGTVDLAAVMSVLGKTRPVFHSEADFQHAFAQVVQQTDAAVGARLEVPQGNREYLDLLCRSAIGRKAIEFKYFTAAWNGMCEPNEEVFRLRTQAAADVARHSFVHDIVRLERFCREAPAPMSGIAIMLTNDRTLWSKPTRGGTRDAAFRIHEGRQLVGTLRWGVGPDYHVPNERTLAGSYQIRWHDYSNLPGTNGRFRWVALETALQP